jgi:hypothetical protein
MACITFVKAKNELHKIHEKLKILESIQSIIV